MTFKVGAASGEALFVKITQKDELKDSLMEGKIIKKTFLYLSFPVRYSTGVEFLQIKMKISTYFIYF